MKKLFLLILIFTSLYAKETIWQGSIGKNQIYMLLPCDPKIVSTADECGNGVYFYKKTLQDIQMRYETLPSSKAFKFRLQVLHSNEENAKAEELFELNYKNNKLVGIWKDKKGKSQKVTLNPYKLKKKCDYMEECFSDLREKFLSYKRGKVQKIAVVKKELVSIQEEHSGVSMFRLGNGFTKATRAKLNPLLDNVHTQNVLSHLSCSTQWEYGSGMETLESKVNYLSDDLLGYQVFSSYFCGGAHPDFGTNYELLDLHSGKKYRLEDLVVFSEKMPKHTEEYSEVWANYTDEVQAKKLRELGFKANGWELKPQGEGNTYDPYSLDYWRYLNWSYEQKGIRIFLSFPSVARAFRGDSFLIPFNLLEPYKNKNFPYAFGDTKAYVLVDES